MPQMHEMTITVYLQKSEPLDTTPPPPIETPSQNSVKRNARLLYNSSKTTNDPSAINSPLNSLNTALTSTNNTPDHPLAEPFSQLSATTQQSLNQTQHPTSEPVILHKSSDAELKKFPQEVEEINGNVKHQILSSLIKGQTVLELAKHSTELVSLAKKNQILVNNIKQTQHAGSSGDDAPLLTKSNKIQRNIVNNIPKPLETFKQVIKNALTATASSVRDTIILAGSMGMAAAFPIFTSVIGIAALTAAAPYISGAIVAFVVLYAITAFSINLYRVIEANKVLKQNYMAIQQIIPPST